MGIYEDRSWMYNRSLPNNKKECTQEFVKGVKEFIEYVIKLPQYEREREMRCPCKKCENRRWLASDIAHEHLLKNGFVPNYWYWTEHGENAPRNQNLQTGMLSSPRGPVNEPHGTNKNTESKAVGQSVKGKEPASGNHKASFMAPAYQFINSKPNLTVVHNAKGKEPASGNHKSSFVAPTFQHINSTPNLTKPPAPTPPVYYLKSDSNTELSSPTSSDDDAHVGTPKSHESSIGRENMTFIQPHGQEITEHKFNGPRKSLEKIHVDVRDSSFNEKEFCCANGLLMAKKSNKRPSGIGQTSWNGLKEEWGKELCQGVCKQNKKKRELDCDGHGRPKQKEKHGEEPTVAEAFMHTHSNLNLEEERVWDERSKRTHRRTEIAGGFNECLLYGLGGMTSQKFNKSNCHVQSEQEQVLINELNSLRSENQKLKNKLATTRTEFNSRMTYMEARFATFEQHMRFISMQQYAAHYMPPMPYPPPPPAAEMPYPPQGGQPSLGPHPSSPPPSNGTFMFVPTPHYPLYVPPQTRTVKNNDNIRDD